MSVLWTEWQKGFPIWKALEDYTDKLVANGYRADGGILGGGNGIPDIQEFRVSGCFDLTNEYR